jgi:hypothetical protein
MERIDVNNLFAIHWEYTVVRQRQTGGDGQNDVAMCAYWPRFAGDRSTMNPRLVLANAPMFGNT